MPTIASPSPRDAFGDDRRVVVECGRLHDGGRALGRLPALKMPEPTNTPSAPSCIMSAASAGVATPPAVNSTTGELAGPRDLGDQVVRRLQLLGRDVELILGQRAKTVDLAVDGADVLGRLRHVAGARFALGADHGSALGDAAQRLPEVGRAADEGNVERPLVDVVHVVGRESTSDSSM